MSLQLNFFIAKRYLRAKNKEKFISVTTMFSFVGIMLGVATLIIVMSVMNGFREDLMNRILGINSHISIYYKGEQDTDDIIKLLKENKNVKSANKIINNQVMLMFNNQTSGAIIKGIEENDLKEKPQIYNTIQAKQFHLKDNDILLGNDLARQLQIKVDDEIKVISPELNSTIMGTIPRIKTYKVVGTFKSGMYEYDSSSVIIPYNTAEKHFKIGADSVKIIEIYLKDLTKIEETKAELLDLINKEKMQANLIDWKESNSTFIGAIDVERNVMFIILMLIIIVATFNIISGLTMLVNDKLEQIALMRTIGFTKQDIMKIFFMCGSIIGIFGTLLGLGLGILVSSNLQNIKLWLESVFGITLFPPSIYFLVDLPSKILLGDVCGIVSISLILSFLSTIYPSYKASKTNPAEVLRYQ